MFCPHSGFSGNLQGTGVFCHHAPPNFDVTSPGLCSSSGYLGWVLHAYFKTLNYAQVDSVWLTNPCKLMHDQISNLSKFAIFLIMKHKICSWGNMTVMLIRHMASASTNIRDTSGFRYTILYHEWSIITRSILKKSTNKLSQRHLGEIMCTHEVPQCFFSEYTLLVRYHLI